jgi:hypothetical protein
MDRRDLTISNDDLAEIFGGAIEVPAAENPSNNPSTGSGKVPSADITKSSKAGSGSAPAAGTDTIKKKEPAAPLAEEKPKSGIITAKAEEVLRAQARADREKAAVAQAAEDIKPLPPMEHSVDDLIRRAQEIEKNIKKDEVRELAFADFLDERTVTEIIEEFNDIKKGFAAELMAGIDKKNVDNMMLRTLEKTAAGFIILKNTNWDADGKLRADGSIDAERLIKNMSAYKDRIKEVDREIEESLKALFFMRIRAVKLGLGNGKYEAMKAGLMKRVSIAEGGYKKSIAAFMRNRIIEPSVKRGDEEK